MAQVRTFQRSFAGGEVTPELFGRIDDAKFQAGLALCKNFITKPHGPAENRAGFQFVREVKDSTKRVKLIPFTYSTTQTMVLEFGDQYIRFHTQGATLLSVGVPYEVVTPYLEADLFDLHYVQSADVLTIVHPNYAPRELRRLGATSWNLTTIDFDASIDPPSPVSLVTAGLTTPKYKYYYVVTAIDADGVSESVASGEALGTFKTITAITKANPGEVTTSAVHNLTVNDKVYVAEAGGMVEVNDEYYTVGSVVSTTKVTLIKADGTPLDTTAFTTFTTGGKLYPAFIHSNLFESGVTVTISWPAVTGASRYNVYKLQGGLFGYIGQTPGTSIVDDNISADLSKTPPLYETVFTTSGNYPTAVSYFEQRRAFAGTTNKPQNVWMTKSGTESNMSYSYPIRDDERISFRIAAREANTVRHIVPMGQLLLLTSSAEWRVTSQNSDAITPTSINVVPQSYVGASNVQPQIVNNTAIYCAARGGHVRELAYNWQASGFLTGDLSLRAPHLFDGLDIVDMTYAKAPIPLVWFVSSSGLLLGLTYVPEQQVGAWHQHDTDGVFESCAVVAEGQEDVLYVVVKREIDGNDVRYVERMASRAFSDQADAFFVDCGLTYDGVPADNISGLDHLEGKTVSILADGAVHPQRVVTAGAVTLDEEASKVQIGLPITADLQTLPFAAQIDNGFGQGRLKNVNKAWLRVYRSSGIFVGPTSSLLTEDKQRTTESYGSPPALKSAEVQIVITPTWGDSGQVFVRQADPLPLTVVSLTLEVEVGG